MRRIIYGTFRPSAQRILRSLYKPATLIHGIFTGSTGILNSAFIALADLVAKLSAQLGERIDPSSIARCVTALWTRSGNKDDAKDWIVQRIGPAPVHVGQ